MFPTIGGKWILYGGGSAYWRRGGTWTLGTMEQWRGRCECENAKLKVGISGSGGESDRSDEEESGFSALPSFWDREGCLSVPEN